jgi:nicotinate-nucleotide pyrophosphorylase (carboxylating)
MKEPGALFRAFKEDGDAVRAGEQAFEAEATVHTLLQCERLILNCMQRMSGIATLTHQYVDKLKGYRTRVLDTRKTTPNFRLLEKEAVRIGGGVNHRFGLYDMILLKDNHIDYCGSMEKAIEMAGLYRRRLAERTGMPLLKIEVETRSIRDVERVMAMGRGAGIGSESAGEAGNPGGAGGKNAGEAGGVVDRIMLDNFSPEQISQALALIGGRYETEASGGINLDNLEAYARTGVDFVSIGALIHQAQSIDLSFKAVI